jgi:uncharacterized protein (DUF952 family)
MTNEQTTESIYHITSPHDWSDALSTGEYAAHSLMDEGFIHCSTRSQVERSLNKFFRGRDGVLVLEIDPRKLRSELRYELADADLFPHVYGVINIDAIVRTDELSPGPDGSWEWEEEKANVNR